MGKQNCLLAALLLFLLTLTGCGYAAPEHAVEQELDLIQQLDESTILSVLSYENLRMQPTVPLGNEEDAAQAAKLFFSQFSYRILASSVDGDSAGADVQVEITNIDAQALAEDLCRAMIRSSVSQGGASGTSVSPFSLMRQCLENGSYPLVSSAVTVRLENQDGTWVLADDAQLANAITGGLVSYLEDPYLLSPEDVLSCTLAPFSDFTANQWGSYLEMDDVFGTGSEYKDALDLALCEQIATYFSFEILDVLQDGDTATATVRIESLDMPSVCRTCRKSLLSYAKTTESIRASDAEIAQKTAEYLLEALGENTASAANTITVELINNGHSWEAVLDDNFSDALLGGMNAGIEELYGAPSDEAADTTDATDAPIPSGASAASDADTTSDANTASNASATVHANADAMSDLRAAYDTV